MRYSLLTVLRCFFVTIFVLLLGACANKEILHVDVFHLKSTNLESTRVGMVRGEQRKRLYGAVTEQQQLERIGLYYTALWNDPNLAQESGMLKFEYLQHITGAKVQVLEYTIPTGQVKGSVDFSIIGSNYIHKGRVLAWRLTYKRDGEVIASEQSYLWE